jgi:hypothetical protein
MKARSAYSSALLALAVCACSSEPSTGNTGGSGGNPGGGAGSPGTAGNPTNQAGGGMSGVAGTIQAGASGTGTGGGVGVGGSGGAAAGSGGAAAGTGGAGGGGPGVPAGCANPNYDLCIDFESGIDTNVWTGGTPGAIQTTDFAHGAHAYRLYPMSGGKLVATKLGKIKNQLWGRFYVHFKPGAPGGHGNLLAAFDEANNWYEMGWQFDAMMGVWHATGGAERPLRSMPFIVDQWYCVETFFDGTKTEMPKWWIDGKEAEYYMAANEMLIPKVLTQFARVEVGFTPYAGLGLQMPDGKGPKDDRVLSDMSIDDIAFSTQRVGCITP